MKHVVVSGELDAAEIRPETLFSEFRQLSIEEAARFFSDPGELVEVACPACASEHKTAVFEKQGFQYQRCEQCRSVFVSPRPTAEALARYYRESRASQFRFEHFERRTSQARRISILRSHAGWLGRLVAEAGNHQARAYADMGTNYPVLFEEIAGLNWFEKLYSADPLPQFDEACRASGAEVRREPLSGLGAVSAFEQIEHQFSPEAMLVSAREMLAEGGMVFLTTRTISGFDLQVLWDKAPYIYVPEHMNLLSIDGIQALMDRVGFEEVELSTPGQLDVQLVQLALQEDPSIHLPSFLAYMLKHRGRETTNEFQEFLQKHRLSSHIRVAAIKR